MAHTRAPLTTCGNRRDLVAIAHGHDRVEMHVAARRGQVDGQHLGRRPPANSRLASSETAWGVVRSPMPIMTAPLPMTSTSPPSTCTRPQSSPTPPIQTLTAVGREHGVEAVDRLHDHRLRLARRLGHGVEGDAAVDPARWVALEHEVGQRRHEHRGGVGRLEQEPDLLLEVGLGDAADEEVGPVAGVSVSTRSAARRAPRWPTLRSLRMWSSAQCLASGCPSASARSSSAWKTSTPRSRMTCTKASCSCLARSTQMTSSKSRSSALAGVSRRCSRPGRWTMTLRRRPTSEWTPNATVASTSRSGSRCEVDTTCRVRALTRKGEGAC